MKNSFKAMYDQVSSGMTAGDYAVQESWDICQACSAMASVAGLMSSEKEEPDDIKKLSAILRSLNAFISGEIDEMEQAGTATETEPAAKKIPAQVRTDEPPAKKSLDLSYIKTLGVKFPDSLDMAVKFVARDQIKGYTFLWGNPDLVDVEHEYFTKSTNFWDDRIAGPRPLTWDHAQDPDWVKGTSPVIGDIVEYGDDEWGRWYSANLHRSKQYRKYLDALIEEKRSGTSSDSAPQYVQRVQTGKATWLSEWPWFASALTVVPAEPRLIGSVDLKSFGITLPDAPQLARVDDTERMRRIKLELYL
jgi:hypothetical protein